MGYYAKLESIPLEAYKRMLDKMVAKAKQELRLSDGDIVIRSLRPDDLGVTGEWTFTTIATGWVTLINTATIADNRYLGINGARYMQSTDQGITQIRITRAGTLARYWDVQGVNLLQDPQVYFDDPITLEQNTTTTVEAYVIATGTEKLGFVGSVVEPRGLLINP